MSSILAIDASTEACSAALWVDGEIASRYEIAPRRHTELLLPMVQEVLGEAGKSLSRLDALAFGRGPGAFTGIRIGTGVVQGLAFAHDLPVVPVSSLQAMAQQAHRTLQAKKVIAAIDARMGEVYAGAYSLDEEGCMSHCLFEGLYAPDQLPGVEGDKWCAVGSGWAAYDEAMQTVFTGQLANIEPELYPDAQDIARLAVQQWQQGNSVSAEQALPVYLRDQVAYQNAKTGK